MAKISTPFKFDEAIARSRISVDACVVVGGSLFYDQAALSALSEGADRGVRHRFLFPSPHSRWLESLVADTHTDVAGYWRRVSEMKRRVSATLPTAAIRWYDAPGPCWFTLVDRSILFTKPFSATNQTIPVPETRPAHIEHFGLLFEQLWERSVQDFNEHRSVPNSAPLVQVVNISEQVIARLCANPDDLSQLSPEGFELLVGDRLATMGLGVQRIGSVNCRDGGIDMIAWPERNAAIPYLLAVQVKHSRKGHTVPSQVVRDLKGVLSVMPFDFGLLVSNTTFSPDARWFAREKPNIIRLRDFEDLIRWVRSDFANESLDRDLPSEISLAPGLRIQIGRKLDI